MEIMHLQNGNAFREAFFPKTFVIQQPHPNLNPGLKPISFLSFMTSGMMHKLHAFEPDLSCTGPLQILFVLYCIQSNNP